MKPYSYYRLLAESDQILFKKELKRMGFEFHKSNQVLAMSYEISEDVNDIQELPPELDAIKELAKALGFIVSYNMRESAPKQR